MNSRYLSRSEREIGNTVVVCVCVRACVRACLGVCVCVCVCNIFFYSGKKDIHNFFAKDFVRQPDDYRTTTLPTCHLHSHSHTFLINSHDTGVAVQST